jgi:hypothetical protein
VVNVHNFPRHHCAFDLGRFDLGQSKGALNRSLEYVTANQAVVVLTDQVGLQKRLIVQVTQNAVLVDGVVWNAQNASGC